MKKDNQNMFVSLNNIHKYYRNKHQTIHALRGVDLTFNACGFVIIYGKSGCGKTSLMNIMAGSIAYDEGEYCFNNEVVDAYSDNDWDNHRKNHVSMIFQDYRLIETLTVYDNIALPLRLSIRDDDVIKDKVNTALNTVGLNGYEKRLPKELSGGEQQRIAIARAIVNDNHVILADEPTGNLDSKTSKAILELMKEISRKRLVIMVTHDEETASKYADRRIQMQDGHVIKDELLSINHINHIEVITAINKTNPLFYKESARMAFANFRTRKIRFFVSYILVVLTFILALYALVGLTFEKEPVLEDFIENQPIHIASIKQEHCLPTTNKSQQCILVSEGKQLYQSLETEGIHPFFEHLEVPTTMNDLTKNITMYEVKDSETYDSFSLIYGDYPTSNNDILMTDFMFREMFGLTDFTQLDHYTITVSETDYNLTGVIRTQYQEDSRFNDYMDEQLSAIEYHYLLKDYGYIVKTKQVSIDSSIRLRFGNLFYDESKRVDDHNTVNIGNYNEETLNIIYGRGIENANEIMVSSRYFANYKLEEHFDNLENLTYSQEEIGALLDENYAYLDIYDEKYGLFYHRFINLHDYIPDVEIVGIYLPSQSTDFLIDSSVYNDIAYEHAMYYGFSSISLTLNHDDLDSTLSTLNENQTHINHMHLPILYQFEQTLTNMNDIIVFLTVTLFSILVLFIYLYISMSIDLRKSQIETMRLLGCTKKQVAQIFYIEHIMGAVVMMITATLLYILSLMIINNRFQSMTNEYDFHYPYNLLRFNGVLLIVVFLVMIFATILSSFITSRQYARVKSGGF